MGSLSLSSVRMGQATVLLSLLLVVVVKGSVFNHRPRNNQGSRQAARGGKQLEIESGGIDFTGCITNPETGLCCIEKTESVSSLKKEPILECTHKNTEQCHYTYVTQFKPSVEEICEETFEKQCQITFKKQAFNETHMKSQKLLVPSLLYQTQSSSLDRGTRKYQNQLKIESQTSLYLHQHPI